MFVVLGISTLFFSSTWDSPYGINPELEGLTITSEDPVITHMKEVTKDLNKRKKKKSLEKYVLGIRAIAETRGAILKKKDTETIKKFATSYLEANFKTERELSQSFKSMIFKVFKLSSWPDCTGEWLENPNHLNNCTYSDRLVIPGFPGHPGYTLCYYECLDPYLAIDCWLVVPCTVT